MKSRKTYWGLLLIIGVIAIGMSGCSWFERHHPTTPETAVIPSDDAASRLNYAADIGVSDNFGVFNGDGFFQIQTPAGDYLLEYSTNTGVYYLAFRAYRAARLLVFLQPDEDAQTGSVYRGTITASDPDAKSKLVTVFYSPGDPGNWDAVFVKDGSDAIRLIDGAGADYTAGGSAIKLFIPKPGKYRLFYTTTIGSFEYPFETTEKNANVAIGLTEGNTVIDAYLQIE